MSQKTSSHLRRTGEERCPTSGGVRKNTQRSDFVQTKQLTDGLHMENNKRSSSLATKAFQRGEKIWFSGV
ncbi:MAG: hypothetical protein CL920_04470 [Deltaproteobacteria bacterium]|nr:hypothetical protein [Deltaproteobacteria bacterium]MBU47932.1 hypothetical protein [Deltaproteobacteria bacterium]